MKRLSYEVLKEQNYNGYLLKDAPERVLQFGEGNFLRAFVEYFIDIMNEKAGFHSKVVLCQPRSPKTASSDSINAQEGLYTLMLHGLRNGEEVRENRVISCVSRCLNPHRDYEAILECAGNPHLRFITCNTTEAGIVYDPSCLFTDMPAGSFPGKLTQFLYRRYQTFGTEKGKGLVILACELIEDNGKELKKCVLQYARQWQLEEGFVTWLKEENLFCSTLVDRIVTGSPKEELSSLWEKLGYEDYLIDTGEIFASWVIEGPQSLKEELPFHKAGLPVLICDDHRPYKQRKVRILNGAHTTMALGAFLAGKDIVRDCMADQTIRAFMEKAISREIIPTLNLPEKELTEFARSVTDRFRNPFIDHSLLAISLNSTAKWKARILPSLTGYIEKFHRLPACLTASLAFYIAFYRGRELTETGLTGMRGQQRYSINDDASVLNFFFLHREDSRAHLVHAVCSNTGFWGTDLTAYENLETSVVDYLKQIEEEGARAVMESCLK